MYDIKCDIKINLERKNVSNVCRSNPETAVKDNVIELFIMTSDQVIF